MMTAILALGPQAPASPIPQDLRLPDGNNFSLWEDKTHYKRILHVAKHHPQASNQNDGSAEQPFLTIQKAADIAGPGDMVLIHEGEYHETVRPLGCGKSADEMLCFKGADGEKVVITGAEVLKGPYRKSEGWNPYRPKVKTRNYIVRADENNPMVTTATRAQTQADKPWQPYQATDEDNIFITRKAKVYMVKIPRGTFIDTNPFTMVNGPVIPWVGNGPSFIFNWAKTDTQQKIALMHRGMVFCDGQRLTQVAGYQDLAQIAGAFFVEDDGLTLHLRLPDDGDPIRHKIEFTAREQCFCPENPYTSFVRIENLTFTKAGNGFSPPQRGALSTNCGNHFIINHCVVEDTNGVGIDIGFQCPARCSMAPRGFQIVSHCTIARCGMAGVCGTTGCSNVDYYEMQQPSIMVVDNQFIDNCWQDFAALCESAALKLHHLRDSLIARNTITNTQFGCAIWTDAANSNIAIRENRILNNAGTGIYVEASHHPNNVEYNVIINNKGVGITSFESDHIANIGNIILGCASCAIRHSYGGTRVYVGRGYTGEGVDFFHNLISDCKSALVQPTEKGHADRNVYGSFKDRKFLKVGHPQMDLDLQEWQSKLGWDKNGRQTGIKYSLAPDRKTLKVSFEQKGRSRESRLRLDAPLKPQIQQLVEELVGKAPAGH